MDPDFIDELVSLGDTLWALGGEHEKKTAMMLYQCACNLNSPNAYFRLYEAKKTTKFKSKKYPNTARQDLLEAVKLHHVDAIIIAHKEKLFSDTSIQLFYLKIAKKKSSLAVNENYLYVTAIIEELVSQVPLFMQKTISDYVDICTEESLGSPPLPICSSCKYSRHWDSVSPFCKVKGESIDKFIEKCDFYSEQLMDATYSDEIKWNMDEAYGPYED